MDVSKLIIVDMILIDFMEDFRYLIFMLSWDLVKAHPVTYRAIDGVTSFEVMVGPDNRKNAITVTRTKGDKFEIRVFRDSKKALRWCEKHS